MKIYISGKIGEENPSPETLARFKAAEDMLKSKGYETFNPTTSGLGQHAESMAQKNGTNFYEEILMLDMQEVKKCDAIYMMGDFFGSDGATAEYYYAIALKKTVFFEDKQYARYFLDQQLMKKIRNVELELSPNSSFLQASKAYFEKKKDKIWLPL